MSIEEAPIVVVNNNSEAADLVGAVTTLVAKVNEALDANTHAIHNLHASIAGMLHTMQEMSEAMAKANEDDDEEPEKDPLARSPVGTPGRPEPEEPEPCEICNGQGVVTMGHIRQPCDCVPR